MSSRQISEQSVQHLHSPSVTKNRDVKAPSRVLTALEYRAVVEAASWSAFKPLLANLKKGDGHPVFVMPGFMATDRSTARLRILLRSLDYRTYSWGLGSNLGPTPEIVDGFADRFRYIVEREQQPVSVIGWSLGGIYARKLAKVSPQHVRQVITLGSPFRMESGDDSAASPMWRSLKHLHIPDAPEEMLGEQGMLKVPSTSVYTRTDGIVDWRTCLETRGPMSENVEVLGSHCGLGFHPAVAVTIADRLAQPVGQWKRFRPPLWLRGLYPIPTSHRVPAKTA